MPKLVDVDALRHRLLCQPPRNISINFALELVSTMPTENAEPVRRGWWLRTEAYPHRIYCSECYATFIRNDEFLHLEDIPHSYCPDCGAKMDESEGHLDERREDGKHN